MFCRWASLNRAERLQKRNGLEPVAGDELEEDRLLPGIIDPITLVPIQNPAMSPSGHVMGFATWKAVLAEFGRCPFTKQPLHKEQVRTYQAFVHRNLSLMLTSLFVSGDDSWEGNAICSRVIF